MTGFVVQIFAWIFSNLLGMSLGKELPRNKFTAGASTLAGVTILCLIAYAVDEFIYYGGQQVHLWIAAVSFVICFWAMLKGFTVDKPDD